MKSTRDQKFDQTSSLRNAAQAALALGLLSLGWMMWDTQDQSKSFSSTQPAAYNSALSPLTVDRINRHMQLTEKKNELRAMATEVENLEIGSHIRPEDFNNLGLRASAPGNPFESENSASKVLKDLEGSRAFDTPVLPEDRVASMLEQDQWLKKHDKKQTDAFLNAVRENARAAGYDLDINDQLQVVKVRRVPNSTPPTK